MADNRIINLALITVIAWSVLQCGHELIGHGLATILVGGTPIAVDAMYFHHDLSEVSYAGVKIVQASGSLFNILFAFSCLLVLKFKPKFSYWTRAFLWISAMINLMQSGSYVAFGRFIHDGMDWAKIIADLEPYVLWATLEFLLGISLIVFGMYVGKRYQTEFFGQTQCSGYLSVLATTTIISTLSSFIIPTDDRFMIVMGGIGNGFTFLFPLLVLAFWKSERDEMEPIPAPNLSISWKVASLIFTIFYLGFMSPGISF